ncbi:MAG: hypothetical protein KF784_02315 [Fimbriimonadaceae bacterium]|nr:hypothetical protein [Fimbriimonadaceae bacterium]
MEIVRSKISDLKTLKMVQDYLAAQGPRVAPERLKRVLNLIDDRRFEDIAYWHAGYVHEAKMGVPAQLRNTEIQLRIAPVTPHQRQQRQLQLSNAKTEAHDRKTRPGTLEYSMKQVMAVLPGLEGKNRQYVKDFLFGAGGMSQVPQEAIRAAIDLARRGEFGELKRLGGQLGASRDPGRIARKFYESGYHVGHLLQGAQSMRHAGISEVALVRNGQGKYVLYGDALNDLAKRTGFSQGELHRLLSGQSELKQLYGVLKEIAGEQFSSDKNWGLTERDLAYGEQKGTLGDDFFTGVLRHTIRNNPDLHLLGDAETGWRYFSQGYNDPTGLY